MENKLQDLASLPRIIDFLRYGLSYANSQKLYYGHGTDNAWDDIWALVLGSLYLPLDLDPILLDAKLTPDEQKYLMEQLKRRVIDRVPVAYLTHQAYFCNMQFYVDPRVLIPRSPLAEMIQQQFSPWIETDQVQNILDLCTGSGCIALACCTAFPDACVDGSDLSAEALAVAEINAQQHGLVDQVNWYLSDGFHQLPVKKYDIIVSNPPYVGADEMKTLPAEYSHEPHMALHAETNGLAFVEQILPVAHRYLSDHGILVVEVGNSEQALVEAYPEVPFVWLDFEYGGHGVFLLTREQLITYVSENKDKK